MSAGNRLEHDGKGKGATQSQRQSRIRIRIAVRVDMAGWRTSAHMAMEKAAAGLKHTRACTCKSNSLPPALGPWL